MSKSVQQPCIVADDVRASRDLAKAWLEELGFHCKTVCNGREAWLAILKSCPDLVLTDLEMPIESGLNLLHSIRSDDSLAIRRTPVIVMTSLSEDQLVEVVHDLGATAVIQKPISKVQLKTLIEQCRLEDTENVGRQFLGQMSSRTSGSVSPALRRLLSDIRVIEAQWSAARANRLILTEHRSRQTTRLSAVVVPTSHKLTVCTYRILPRRSPARLNCSQACAVGI